MTLSVYSSTSKQVFEEVDRKVAFKDLWRGNHQRFSHENGTGLVEAGRSACFVVK